MWLPRRVAHVNTGAETGFREEPQQRIHPSRVSDIENVGTSDHSDSVSFFLFKTTQKIWLPPWQSSPIYDDETTVDI
jgi:hypothetical protein